MKNDFKVSSEFPTTNKELVNSGYSNGTQLLNTCNTKILNGTRGLPSGQVIFVNLEPEKRLIVGNSALRSGVKDATDQALQTLDEHIESFILQPHLPDRLLSVGGFLWASQGNCSEPRQYLCRSASTGNWTQPSRYVGGNPCQALVRSLIQDTGIVVVNDELRQAAVIIPFLKTFPFENKTSSLSVGKFDPLALKKEQAPHIISELDKKGLAGYSIEYRLTPVEIVSRDIPRTDRINLSYPNLGYQEDAIFRAYGVKNVNAGAFSLSMPFHLSLPAGRVISIDCSGQQRDTKLVTGAELLKLQKDNEISPELKDVLARPASKNGFTPQIESRNHAHFRHYAV